MEYKIRKAVRKDMPHVLELIKQLAAYEKASDLVEITVEDLEKEGFGSTEIKPVQATVEDCFIHFLK